MGGCWLNWIIFMKTAFGSDPEEDVCLLGRHVRDQFIFQKFLILYGIYKWMKYYENTCFINAHFYICTVIHTTEHPQHSLLFHTSIRQINSACMSRKQINKQTKKQALFYYTVSWFCSIFQACMFVYWGNTEVV